VILGVLQARMSSRRLPGKVLADVAGRPLLARQLERVARARRLDGLVVATSTEASDDPIEALCRRLGVDCARGSLHDVLDRVVGAAAARGAEHVVRLTGDCPLLDPALLDRVVEIHMAGDQDYTSNALERTFPDGLDVEVVRHRALEEAWREARDPYEREHVTPFLYRRPHRYALRSVTGERSLGHLRWCVDEPADLAFVRAVFARLLPIDPDFDTEAVLALLGREPELASGPLADGSVPPRAPQPGAHPGGAPA